MSFVDILPLEIVHEILSRCIDESDFIDDWPGRPSGTSLKGLPNYPTSFLGVCKTWAEAALACPKLWSSIPIRIGEELGRRRQYTPYYPPLRVIEAWIRWSSPTRAPLAISIRPLVVADAATPRYASSVIRLIEDVLLPHHGRWWKIAFWLSFGHLPSALETIAVHAKGFPALEHVSLVGQLERRRLVQFLNNVPSLNSLHIVPSGPRNAPSTLDPASLGSTVPWNYIRSIRLGEFEGRDHDAESALVLMRGCPRLEALQIPMQRPGNPSLENMNLPVTRHDLLRELSLEGSSRRQCIVFFQHLTLPNLKSVALNFTDGFGEHDMVRSTAESFRDFVSRSRCVLDEFTYRRLVPCFGKRTQPHPSHLVLPFLPIVSPSVTRLFVEIGRQEADDFINDLTHLASRPGGDLNLSVCPLLRHLTLIIWAPDAVSQSARLFRFIRSRWLKPAGRDTGFAELQTALLEIDIEENSLPRLGFHLLASESNVVHSAESIREFHRHLGGLVYGLTGPTCRGIQLTIVEGDRVQSSRSFGVV
ncbi:hypothetical protein FA13DRAFT_1729226 [Coprinellus micaceus]|uniref:F-box domain-containing protein n=1 Tax=Coprinellus micaceus TaxID=71717 RepID=A0A4Y7TM40_COPMI|nr:hypothetical protein FA13DRAFT_1729226 [Coprinellus micaceus]